MHTHTVVCIRSLVIRCPSLVNSVPLQPVDSTTTYGLLIGYDDSICVVDETFSAVPAASRDGYSSAPQIHKLRWRVAAEGASQPAAYPADAVARSVEHGFHASHQKRSVSTFWIDSPAPAAQHRIPNSLSGSDGGLRPFWTLDIMSAQTIHCWLYDGHIKQS